jgi:putative chitinase
MTILSDLILGGFLGMIGQSARAIVGIKKNYKKKKNWFDLKRLIVSLCIGFVAGVLGSILIFGREVGQFELMFLVFSGYAGTDFVEGFVRKHIRK